MVMLKSKMDALPPEILAIFDSALEGIMMADANCIIFYVNPAYCRITGRQEQEEIGRPLKPEPPFGPLRKAITEVKSFYGCRYRPEGSKAELIVNASPFITNGEVKGGVSFSQDISDLLLLTKKLEEKELLVDSLARKLEGLCSAEYTFDDIIGRSSKLLEVLRIARKAANSSSTVLLTGESGTGKELFAHAIHSASKLSRNPFIKVNSAAIPENLLENELFGHEKGAFTGATTRRIGLFERADGGTLFLDEIGDMSLSLQAKLLRVLEDGEITRLGGLNPINVNVRIIAATNRNLLQMVKERTFREELYYRLDVIRINIPALRERKEDIPLLLERSLKRLNQKLAKRIIGLDQRAMKKLLVYCWPGNIRELENVIERAANLVDTPVIPSELLLLPNALIIPKNIIHHRTDANVPSGNDGETVFSLAEQREILIQRALNFYGDSVVGKRQAAKALGISLATLYKRIKELSM
jgi:PAS domain S-box-containing protein